MKKNHSKIVSLILVFAMVFSLVACSSGSGTATVEKPKEEKTEAKGNGTYEGKADGFDGDVKATVTLKDGRIEDLKVEAKGETPTIGGAAINSLTEKIIKAQSTQLDVVSGATFSSKALFEAVNEALKAGGIDPSQLKPVESTDEKIELNQEADVVVVGAGGAGLTAAITAKESGKSVIIVEKATSPGGNTNRATGGMNAAQTHYQKEQGIEDTVESFYEDTMKGGHDINNKELVKKLAESSSSAIDWLDSIGAKLSNVGLAGGASYPRQHRPVDENGKIVSVGTYLVEKLSAEAKKAGVKTIYGAQVDEILMDKGMASGVTANTADGKLTIKAKAVIVASGGFGGSDELVSKYRPELKGYVSTNAPTITGDAIAFLEKVNANFVDMEQIQTHPTVVQKDGSLVSESLRGDGAILLNKEGLRFIDEMETRDTVSNAINEQTDKTAWLVVDQGMYDESKVVQKYVSQGLLNKADDFSAVAKIIGSDEGNVEKSITTWSTYVANNEDPDFNHKNLDVIKHDLSSGPYYVGPVGPGIHHTMGGVEIDTNAKIIDTNGNPIPGLFAAGEVTGGVHGGNRLGGNAVADIVVFGRVAGQSAIDYLKK